MPEAARTRHVAPVGHFYPSPRVVGFGPGKFVKILSIETHDSILHHHGHRLSEHPVLIEPAGVYQSALVCHHVGAPITQIHLPVPYFVGLLKMDGLCVDLFEEYKGISQHMFQKLAACSSQLLIP
jgi:hypothetical protein